MWSQRGGRRPETICCPHLTPDRKEKDRKIISSNPLKSSIRYWSHSSCCLICVIVLELIILIIIWHSVCHVLKSGVRFFVCHFSSAYCLVTSCFILKSYSHICQLTWSSLVCPHLLWLTFITRLFPPALHSYSLCVCVYSQCLPLSCSSQQRASRSLGMSELTGLGFCWFVLSTLLVWYCVHLWLRFLLQSEFVLLLGRVIFGLLLLGRKIVSFETFVLSCAFDTSIKSILGLRSGKCMLKHTGYHYLVVSQWG